MPGEIQNDASLVVNDDTSKANDVEKASPSNNESATSAAEPQGNESTSAFKALGWLDRLLAVWILLAMVIGVLLGNFVPATGPALDKGKFVGVSVPIGKSRVDVAKNNS